MTPQQISNQNRYASFFLLWMTIIYYGVLKKLGLSDDVLIVTLVLFFGVRRPVIVYYFFKRLYLNFQYEVRHIEKYADWEKRGAFKFTWFAPYALIVTLLFQAGTRNLYFLPIVLATAALFFYQKKKGRLPEAADDENGSAPADAASDDSLL